MPFPKKLRFVSGLPRAGSTLLCNLLAQNPDFHVTSTSGILAVLLMVRNQWDGIEEFKATPNEAGKIRVLRGILEYYHGGQPDQRKPVVFDKSRGWLAYLELAEHLLGEKPKVLVPVRDVRDVIASFEKLWRKHAHSRAFPQELVALPKWQTVQGRAEIWSMSDQPVGIAYNRIKDALHRGFRDRMHFVVYEELTSNPRKVMKGVYEFLGEPFFNHEFDHVQQVTQEDDLVYGIPDLHTIRPKIEPQPPQWPSILGREVGESPMFRNLELW